MNPMIANDTKRNPLSAKDWEADIAGVVVETCDTKEDPLGYKAIFYFHKECERFERNKSFVVGASFLAQRAHNLIQAGYKAPMTQKAIDQIEREIGGELPLRGAEHLARAV